MRFVRTEMLLGKNAMEILKASSVAVFGVGGVGSFAAEALARSGVGHITLFDNDTVSLSNINRQLIATQSTVGIAKVNVMRDRIKDINPECEVNAIYDFYGAETAGNYDLSIYSYVIDAIDTITSKILLIEKSKAANTKIISCMGAGNKLDATKFEFTDIYQTSICPLAKVMRKELRKRGIDALKVLYSTEVPVAPDEYKTDNIEMKNNRAVPGSTAFVPSVAGLLIAGEVIKDIAASAQ